MATEKLYKIRLVGLQRQKGEVLDFLQEKGIMHLNPVEEIANEHHLERDRPLATLETISEHLLDIRWMQEQLSAFAPKIRKKPFTQHVLKDLLKRSTALKKTIQAPLIQSVKRITAQKEELKEKTELLHLLSKIPFSLGPAYPHEGKITFTWILESSEEEPLNFHVMFEDFLDRITLITDKNMALVQGLNVFKDELEQIIKQEAVKLLTVPSLRTSREATIKTLKAECARLTASLEKEYALLRKMAHAHFGEITQLHYLLEIFHDRHEIATSFLRTGQTFMLEGYVAVREYTLLERLAQQVHVHISKEEVADAPSKLRHLPYVKNYAFITKMFGLPSYMRVDPTPYMSIFIPLFFGFMFSDIGYAILLVLTSLLLLWKSSSETPVMRDAGVILFVCSLSTILFGWFFGSFFGNLIFVKPLILDPFQGAKTVLIMGLAVGLLHINLGLLLASYENLKRFAFKDFLLNNLSLFLLQVGAMLIVFGLMTSGIFALSVALLLLIIKSKLMGVLEVTGFVGTWLSYARLLAMSLATGGIALSINIMANQLSSVKLFGPVLFIFLIVMGHLFNFVINILGSSINSVRLHYIEFFSQWYEGGGKPFQPFNTVRVKDTL